LIEVESLETLGKQKWTNWQAYLLGLAMTDSLFLQSQGELLMMLIRASKWVYSPVHKHICGNFVPLAASLAVLIDPIGEPVNIFRHQDSKGSTQAGLGSSLKLVAIQDQKIQSSLLRQ
jgi:hypothetical protein